MPVTLKGGCGVQGGAGRTQHAWRRWAVALLALVSVAAATLSSQQVGTALVDAAKAQDAAAVRALLAQGVDVNAPYGDGTTALHWAVHWDDRETAERLIGAGARVNAADDHGITPLVLACLNGSSTIVELLLKGGANPNLASVVNETPLMTAARTGNADVVRLLLAHGADVKATESARGQTALMHAVAENHAAVVQVLIEHGADARARSTNRFTPLLFAAQQGNLETARLLVAAGADVNESAPDGIAGDTNARAAFKPDTDAAALLVAIDSGHEEMARFLLEHGADPNHHGAGRTALHSAVQQAMPELVKALLAHGTDPNARLDKPMPLLSRFIQLANGLEPSAMGATPFWLAASYGDVSIMRILLAHGADPNLTSNDGTTPLMVAAGVDFVEGQDKYGRRWFQDNTLPLQERAVEAVKLCLELGSDINAANEKGQTALHGAVYLGTMVISFLAEHDAKINVVNKRGQTPWLIAAKGEYRAGSFYSHKDRADLLAKLGADTSLGADLGPDFQRKLKASQSGR